MKSQKTKGGARKHGRNKVKCAGYKALHKREKAKARRRERHLKKYPGDLQA